jgi:hypothetical protein
MEIAFISSNKIYLEIEKKIISKILTKLTEKPSKFIAAMLIEQYSLGSLWLLWVLTDESDRFVRVSLF